MFYPAWQYHFINDFINNLYFVNDFINIILLIKFYFILWLHANQLFVKGLHKGCVGILLFFEYHIAFFKQLSYHS